MNEVVHEDNVHDIATNENALLLIKLENLENPGRILSVYFLTKWRLMN